MFMTGILLTLSLCALAANRMEYEAVVPSDDRPPRTWTVGHGNLFDFSEIQEALDQSITGDLILVDPASERPYQQFEVTKAVKISSLGPEPFLVSWAAGGPAVDATISIRGLKGDDEAILSHVRIAHDNLAGVSLEVADSTAPISIIDLQIEVIYLGSKIESQFLVISNCSRVYLSEPLSSDNPRCNLSIHDSRVEIYRPRLRGASAHTYHLKNRVGTIRAFASELVMYGPRITGGRAGGSPSAAVEGQPAVELFQGSSCRMIGMSHPSEGYQQSDHLTGGEYTDWWECYFWDCCTEWCQVQCCYDEDSGSVPGGPAVEAYGRSRAAIEGLELWPGEYQMPVSRSDPGSSIVIESTSSQPTLEKYALNGPAAVDEPIRVLIRGEPGSVGTLFVSDEPRIFAEVDDGPVLPSSQQQIRNVQEPFLSEQAFQIPEAGHLMLETVLSPGRELVGHTLILQARVDPPRPSGLHSRVWTNALSSTLMASLGDPVLLEPFISQEFDADKWVTDTDLTIGESPTPEPSEPYVLVIDNRRTQSPHVLESLPIDLSLARQAFIVFSYKSDFIPAGPGAIQVRYLDTTGRWREALVQRGDKTGPFIRLVARLPKMALRSDFVFQLALRERASGVGFRHFIDDIAVYRR